MTRHAGQALYLQDALGGNAVARMPSADRLLGDAEFAAQPGKSPKRGRRTAKGQSAVTFAHGADSRAVSRSRQSQSVIVALGKMTCYDPRMKSFPNELEEHDAQFTEEGELIADYARLAGMATAATEPVDTPKRARRRVPIKGIIQLVAIVAVIAFVLYVVLK